MSNKQILGLLGCMLLIIGTFAPAVSIGRIGGVSYFNNGKGDGAFVMVFAVISLLLVLARRFRWLWITGLLSLAFVAYDMVNMQSAVAKEANSIITVQLDWGWAAMILGALLILGSAAVRLQPTPPTAGA